MVRTCLGLLVAFALSACGGAHRSGTGPSSTAKGGDLITAGGGDRAVAEYRDVGDDELPPPEQAFLDFDEIARRGRLRVLIVDRDEESLPRAGLPRAVDRELVVEFAARHGLQVEFVVAHAWDRLIPLLLDGRGDLIASNLTVTPSRSKRVTFTRPVAVVDEVVVGRAGAPDLPRSAKELAGRRVHVRRSSAFADTLEDLAGDWAKGLELIPAPEELDSEQLVYQVGRGEIPLTVADSHLMRAIRTYNDDVVELFSIARGRQIAWAVRRESPQLRTALDAFLIEKALTFHTVERFTGDLDGIRKRGVLRVLTRNNPVTYYLYRGQQFGFDYELSRLAAKTLGVRLEMVVPPSRELLVPWLLDGRGDVIAASFSVTPERERQVSFTRPYLAVRELLVQSARGPKLARPEDLKGQRIHVRRSSSYRRTLEALQARYGPFEIVDEAEDLETEELIDAVAGGQIPFTVADSHLMDAELTTRDDVEAAFALAPPGAKETPIAFAVRKESPKLKAALDRFVAGTYRGLDYNLAKKRYFETRRRQALAKAQRAEVSGDISPYDDLLRKHASRYGLDWRLMAAQAFQESRFDPKATSWVGAKGLFQVMPATGQELGFRRLEDPDQGIHAGVKYMHRLINQFEPTLPFRQRVRFALAAYNAGYGHVADARRLARELKLDPNRWFQNVEKAMLLLEKPQYYRRARHGYCRGSEPVKYVSEIQNRYDNYVKLLNPAEVPEGDAR